MKYCTRFDDALERMPDRVYRHLTPRQQQVVDMRRAGYSVAEILLALDITYRTYWSHRTAILRRCRGARNGKES